MKNAISKKETERLINEAVSRTVDELINNNLIRKSNKNTYQKTEQLLYNYNNFKNVVADKQEMIEQINKVGLSKHSNSILPMPQDLGYKEPITEQEKKDNAIIDLENSIKVTQNFITIIDKALKAIENDPYYKIIEMYYFMGLKLSVISKSWDIGIDEATISRNKSRLVKQLSIYLFSDEVIKELYL